VTTTKVSLSQAQLDAIEAQVKSVRAKYEALKVQVQVFVAVRDIQQKINALTSQMPAASAAAAPAPTIGAPAGQAQAEAATTTALTNRQEIEAKIAATKQQIAELTQELQTMKGAGQPTGAVVSQPTAGTGAVSEQKETTTKIETPSKPVQTQTSQPQTQPKGFWQSIADFFKKLFTF
jgi:DNA repair exonuclease SbcCD ATPase subunit